MLWHFSQTSHEKSLQFETLIQERNISLIVRKKKKINFHPQGEVKLGSQRLNGVFDFLFDCSKQSLLVALKYLQAKMISCHL